MSIMNRFLACFPLILACTTRIESDHAVAPGKVATATTPIDQAWLEKAMDNIRQEQLEIQVLPDFSSRAVSIGVDFETLFDAGGLDVSRRHSDDGGGWSLRWEFVEARSGGRVLASEADLPPEALGKHVLFQRSEILELYENTENGVEQKFVLDTPPVGTWGNQSAAPRDLVVLGRFVTSLAPRRAPGRGIIFSEGSRDRLLYTEPVVYDAAGRQEPGELTIRPGVPGEWISEIRVAADWLEGASYPVVIDPLLTSPQELFGPNFSYFGSSVATAGDVDGNGLADVIIGAYNYSNGEQNEGKVFVYYATPTGLPTNASWEAEGNQLGANFGFSVATAGDVNGDRFSDIIIGTPQGHMGGPPPPPEGIVYVYHGGSGGLQTTSWGMPSWRPDWTARSNQSLGDLGRSVSTAGDVNGDGYSDVILGAPRFSDPMGGAESGAAFVYHGSGTGLPIMWSGMGPNPTPDWWAYGAGSSKFGSVSTAGDVNGDGFADVVIGAHRFTFTVPPMVSEEGSVLVWHGSSGGLGTPPGTPGTPSNANWTARSRQEVSFFGISVSTAGDVNGDGCSDLIIGASQYDDPESNEGRAFAYHGCWPAACVPPACGLSNNPESDTSKPNPIPDWTAAPTNEVGAGFGAAVSTAGDINGDGHADVIIGAPTSGSSDVGAAYVYEGSSTGLPAASTFLLYPFGAPFGANFGASVSTAGDVDGDGYSDVIVGAPRPGDIGPRAYVYRGSPAGLSTSSNWNATGPPSGYAAFGYSVASAGDVNGDGFADVIIGSPAFDNGETDEGVANLFLGSATGLSTSSWLAESNQAQAQLGTSVANAGDVNGDGYSDVIIGAPVYSNGPAANSGRVFVWYGSASGMGSDGWPSNADWWSGSDVNCSGLGFSVATAGDVNGDGFSDVVVGAPSDDTIEVLAGRVFVFHGSSGGLPSSCLTMAPDQCAQWNSTGDMTFHQYGYTVASAGDVNRDGFSDVIIGEPKCGANPRGRAVVYHGSDVSTTVDLANGLLLTPDWVCEGRSPQDGAAFGHSVSSAGDVNGDGYSDVIIGSPGFDTATVADAGRADVWYGSEADRGLPKLPASTTCATTGTSLVGDQTGAEFGRSVATLADVNGDGISDVIVGAPRYTNGSVVKAGRASVYYGSGSGLAVSANWSQFGQSPFAYYGWSVAAAGDVSGDGYFDAIVGAHGWDGSQPSVGRADLYYGGGSRGLAVAPQQVRGSDGLTPVQLLGSSDSPTQVSMRLRTARSWMGRSRRAKLQWEVRPVGTAFTGPVGCGGACGSSSTWTDIGTAGAQVESLLAGLSPDTIYHWRVRVLAFPSITGAWYSVGPNAASETDFRTPP